MPIELNVENFNQETQSDKLTIVDFWAPWCGPCKMLSPVLDEIEKEYGDKIKVCKVNTDENPDLASQFQVSSIPLVVLLKSGKPVDQFIGFKTKNAVKQLIDSHL